ncbi:MAG TPA: hypothetical protein VFZ22_14445 [Pyrinomonadaceae bacterium]|nr:hypothetical protein [Pyrinomonadaceae bacterium]
MKYLILILIATFALLGVVPAQQFNDKGQREAKAKEQQELEKKTTALLNEVVSASWSLKSPENRSFVMTSAADLLWSSDQKRARTLYWDALNSLNLTTATRTPGENPSKAEQEKLTQEFLSNFELRQNMLRKVARKDPQLALDMLRATRQVPPSSQYVKARQLPDDRDLEQEIATEVIARDPAQALKLARDSLAKGFSYELMNLLYLLNQKDSEKALQFAGEIIAKLRSANLATDLKASAIAVELLQSSRTHTARLVNASTYRGPISLALSDEQKRELVDSLTNAMLTLTANSNLLNRINYLWPEVDQFFPERRAALEKKLGTFNQTLSRDWREGEIFNTLIREGRAEELVRKASSPEGEKGRAVWYGQAALIAVGRGETESFRELVAKEIKDETDRNRVLDFLDSQELELAVFKKRVDDLQKLLPKIRRKEARARAMAELAMLLKEKGEDQAASELLDDAATMIKTDLQSESQTNALLALLGAYAVVDPPKAFAMAERTIDQANSQLAALLLLDRVFKTGAIKKGELLLEQTSSMPIDFMVFKYRKSVAALAKADFGRTRALAERFDRNELRVMARLLIVKSLMQTDNVYDGGK